MFLQNIDLTLKLQRRWYLCAPTFSESNALDFCLMTGILENVPAPFQSVPTIFWRLAVMLLKMMEDFWMTF